MKHPIPDFPVGAMYAPFCRTLPPPADEWAADLAAMSAHGFGCAHGFAEWSRIERRKGVYDFTEIDRFVDGCAKAGLAAIVNIATQNGYSFYIPRWLMNESAGAGFVDSTGRAPERGQFFVPCIDDPQYLGYAHAYMGEVARHFAGDERVKAFVLWGEPVLFSASGNGPICYCAHTVERFRGWLQRTYGTIGRLNEVWGTEGPSDYDDFGQILPPTGFSRQMGGYASWQDWRAFMDDNFAAHIAEAQKILRDNGAGQPTIVELVCGLGNPYLADSRQLSDIPDVIGVSNFNRPDKSSALSYIMADSLAKRGHKDFFVVEAQGGARSACPTPVSPSADELKSELAIALGYGARGLMYWCWRPRLSDTEGGEFGLTRNDGRPTEKAIRTGRFVRKLAEIKEVYENVSRKARVAVYVSARLNRLLEAERMAERYERAVRGAVSMLLDLHIEADFIDETAVTAGGLSGYDALICACTTVVDEAAAENMAAFARGGGCLIADCGLAEKNAHGVCYTRLPGGGLDAVFGAERDEVVWLERSVSAREAALGMASGRLDVLAAAGAAVTGRSDRGEILLTENAYGKGRACYFAAGLFESYGKKPAVSLRAAIGELLEKSGVRPNAALKTCDGEDEPALLCVTASGGGHTLVTVVNTRPDEREDTLVLPKGQYTVLETGESFERETRLVLGGRGSAIVYGRRSI